jgi:hypothetical protein
MKCTLWTIFVAACVGMSLAARAQAPADRQSEKVLDIRGDRRPSEAEKLNAVWLYPEDYIGQTIRLRGFLFEPENLEYIPDQNGYLFSCEPLIYGRNDAYHAHVGNATFLSQEKLNFFCSTADGRRIRQLFKEHQGEIAMPAEVLLEVRQRNGLYFGDLVSFTPPPRDE